MCKFIFSSDCLYRVSVLASPPPKVFPSPFFPNFIKCDWNCQLSLDMQMTVINLLVNLSLGENWKASLSDYTWQCITTLWYYHSCGISHPVVKIMLPQANSSHQRLSYTSNILIYSAVSVQWHKQWVNTIELILDYGWTM